MAQTGRMEMQVNRYLLRAEHRATAHVAVTVVLAEMVDILLLMASLAAGELEAQQVVVAE